MNDQLRDESIRIAFAAVFGAEGSRTKEQRIVWSWLVHFCRRHKSTYETRDRDHALFLEGRREVLLGIEQRLLSAPETIDQILQHTGEHTDGE